MTKSELLEILQGLQPDDQVANFSGALVSDVIKLVQESPEDFVFYESPASTKLISLSEVTRWETYLALVGRVEMEVNQYTGKPRVKKKTQQERELGPDLIKVLRLYS